MTNEAEIDALLEERMRLIEFLKERNLLFEYMNWQKDQETEAK